MPPSLKKEAKGGAPQISGSCYERELSAAIRELDLEFERWKNGEILLRRSSSVCEWRLRPLFRSIWFVGGGVVSGECLRLG